MLNRAILVLLSVFWLAMNYLLWRAEYGDKATSGSPVPPEVVWDKILNCPDASSLGIFSKGLRVGQCTFQTSVSEEMSKLDDAPQKGIKAGNSVRLEGGFSLPERRGRVRFDSSLKIAGNQQWERFQLRIARRVASVEIDSQALKQSVHLKATDGETDFEREFTFAELQNPMTLLEGLLDPITVGMVAGLEPGLLAARTNPGQPLLTWQARSDTVNIGHEPVRVYRLQTRLFERFDVVLFVSRAGEILKAQLPHGIVLTHDRVGVN